MVVSTLMACEFSRSPGASAVLEKITSLQREIALINLHERSHVRNGEAGFEPTCRYCQPGKEAQERKKAPGSVVSELERCVESDGKAGAVLVPKSWAGRKVRVVLLE